MKLRQGLLAVAIAAIVAACSSSGATTAPSADLEIYAAASLKNALAEVERVYEAANPGITLTVSTDSSAALATKIQEGAPADVFLSADMTNPQKLVDGGLTSGAVVPFAGNTLTVIVPTANPGGLQSPMDLAKEGIKVIAAEDTVPITKYANELVANLAKEPGYPADFAALYTANIVSKEQNVSAVVAKIELGEGDAAIVYQTDAKGSDKVTAIAVPDSANVPATYGGVVVKASPDQEASSAFLTWLAGSDGQAVLAQFGFVPPTS